MNDVTLTVDAICILVVRLSFAYLLLALAGYFRAKGKAELPKVWVSDTVSAPATTAPGVRYQLDIQTTKVLPEVTVVEEVICGNCNKKIESKPFDPKAEHYSCEHCGMPVGLVAENPVH